MVSAIKKPMLFLMFGSAFSIIIDLLSSFSILGLILFIFLYGFPIALTFAFLIPYLYIWDRIFPRITSKKKRIIACIIMILLSVILAIIVVSIYSYFLSSIFNALCP